MSLFGVVFVFVLVAAGMALMDLSPFLALFLYLVALLTFKAMID